MEAMIKSLGRAGYRMETNSWDSDMVIIWSMLWAGRMEPNQAVWQHYRSQGRRVIVIDVGALYRGETWKIALNTITRDGYYGHTHDLDWDRPRKLGISLAVNLSRNPAIVIAAQHARSQQVVGLDSMESWVRQKIDQLLSVTDRPIVVRPHPRSPLDINQLGHLPAGVTIEKPQRMTNTYDSYNLAFDCHAVVNYNSGPGIQSALAGTRPLVDATSLAWPVSVSMADLEQPYTQDRFQWLTEICHTEYTVAEIEEGLWIRRLGI